MEKASVSFKTKRGEVLFDPERVTQTEIVNKVNQIGFKATVIEEKSSRTQSQKLMGGAHGGG